MNGRTNEQMTTMSIARLLLKYGWLKSFRDIWRPKGIHRRSPDMDTANGT